MVNILCAGLLGPYYGVGVAFVASLLRNLLGLGSLRAFPGSMFGALLCGIVFQDVYKRQAQHSGVAAVGASGGSCFGAADQLCTAGSAGAAAEISRLHLPPRCV